MHDCRVVRCIIHFIRYGLQWRDAPASYGPHKTPYNRLVRWSRLGMFVRMFAALAAEGGPTERGMINSTRLKAPSLSPPPSSSASDNES